MTRDDLKHVWENLFSPKVEHPRFRAQSAAYRLAPINGRGASQIEMEGSMEALENIHALIYDDSTNLGVSPEQRLAMLQHARDTHEELSKLYRKRFGRTLSDGTALSDLVHPAQNEMVKEQNTFQANYRVGHKGTYWEGFKQSLRRIRGKDRRKIQRDARGKIRVNDDGSLVTEEIPTRIGNTLNRLKWFTLDTIQEAVEKMKTVEGMIGYKLGRTGNKIIRFVLGGIRGGFEWTYKKLAGKEDIMSTFEVEREQALVGYKNDNVQNQMKNTLGISPPTPSTPAPDQPVPSHIHEDTLRDMRTLTFEAAQHHRNGDDNLAEDAMKRMRKAAKRICQKYMINEGRKVAHNATTGRLELYAPGANPGIDTPELQMALGGLNDNANQDQLIDIAMSGRKPDQKFLKNIHRAASMIETRNPNFGNALAELSNAAQAADQARSIPPPPGYTPPGTGTPIQVRV